MSWLDRIGEALMALLAAVGLTGAPAAPVYQGYVEGEALYIAAPAAGTLQALRVRRGQRVEAEAPLFALDLTAARAEHAQAEAALAQAKAGLADLRKGRRPEEIDVIAAQKAQAEAALQLSDAQLRRQEALVGSSASSRERLDEARATRERDRARVRELAAQIEVARLPARADALRAAEAAVDMAAARLV